MSKTVDEIRIEYLNNKTLCIGQQLKNGTTIIDRRSNYVICEDSSGKESKLFVVEAYELQESLAADDKKFQSKNIPDDIIAMFEDVSSDNYYNALHAVKALDQLFEDSVDSVSALERAKKYLSRMGVLEQHDYIDMFELQESVSHVKPLKHKSKQSGIAFKTLAKVFKRGMAAYAAVKADAAESANHAMSRVDSFIKRAKSFNLVESVPSEPVTEEKVEEADNFEGIVDHLANNPEEIDKLADKIDDLEDIVHHYDDDEIVLKLEEHLSREERIKRKIAFTRSKSNRERRREIALKRLSTPAKVKQKARKAAVELLKERISKKPVSELSVAEKDRLEDIIAKRKEIINRLANKLVMKIRKIEQNRVYNSKKLHEAAEDDKGERVDTADKDVEIVDVDGKEVVVSHPAQAVFSDGGVEQHGYVAR